MLLQIVKSISELLFERKVSKSLDSLLEKKEYKKIMNSISRFQKQFIDSELDKKSFQDFLLKNETRSSLYKFIYEKYSSEIVLEKEVFISNIVSHAMSYMNELNAKNNRPIFINNKLLHQYFDSLLTELNNQVYSNLSIDSKEQLIAINALLEERFSRLYYTREVQLSTEFLAYSLNRTINNLGSRYTASFNIKTHNRWPLECVGKSSDYILEINKKRVKALESYSMLCNMIENNSSYNTILVLNNIISKECIKLLKKEVSYTTKFSYIIDSIVSIHIPDIYWIEELSNEEKSRFNFYVERARDDLSDLKKFLEASKYQLIDHPYLLITGSAGIGKSHLLADYAKMYIERGHATLMLLGSYFYKNADPGNQITEWLRIPSSSFKSILEQLERKSMETGLRSLIFIDALNEGAGLAFWKERLNGLIKEIQAYSSIGIVLSVRSEYESLIIPEEFMIKLNFKKIEHTGFAGTVNDSIKEFCKHYNLAYPTVPSFNEEYNNPLFLKMVCQLLVDSNVSHFSSNFSIELVINHYIDKLESTISSKERMNFDSRRKVIQKSIYAIASLKIADEWSILNYDTVYDKLVEVGKSLGIENSGNLLKELINEGLLQVIDIGENKLLLDFQFEKFSDFFVADYIYQIYIKSKKIDSFENIPELSSYFKDTFSLRNNYGMLIMLTTIIANHEKKEINSYFSKLGNSYLILEIIFESLPYREPKSISNELVDFIEKKVSTVPELMKYFVYAQFQLSINKNSPINANWLHEFLKEKNQQEIDLIWTINISKPNTTFVSQFSKWYRTSFNIEHIFDVELILVQLGWILSSTNRYSRDQATLAIVKILTMKTDLINYFILKFVRVSDRYVVERAMAAVYGAITNITDNRKITDISNCVYKNFFDVEEIIPHVLAKNYGRQIINYANYCGALDKQKIDLSKVFPAYDGEWKYNAISDDRISELKKKYSKHSGFDKIVHSMTTNYGRAQGGYGDFGRYTFQSTLSPWENQFDLQDLSNITINRCLELGYSPELFSEFDSNGNFYLSRHYHKEERIGKKYQWIAFYEILDQISDNFIPYDINVIYDNEYKEYLNKKRGNLFNLLLSDANENVYEEEIKEKEHIIKEEKVYQEKWKVWDSSLRDIDVTVTDENLPLVTNKLFYFTLPKYVTNKWIEEKIDSKTLEHYLSTEIKSEQYYALSFYHDERRKNENVKDFQLGKDDNLTIMGRAVFVKNSQLDEFHDKMMNDIDNVSSPSTYNIFLREYYWSEAFHDWEKEINEFDESYRLYEHSTHCYSWEKAQQYTSLNEEASNEMLSMLMPSKLLVDYGNLKMDSDYYWRDERDSVTFFDGRVIGSERVLLGRKDFIDRFCLENNYSIVWQCYFDKIGLNQYHDSHYYFVKEENEYAYYEQDDKYGSFNR